MAVGGRLLVLWLGWAAQFGTVCVTGLRDLNESPAGLEVQSQLRLFVTAWAVDWWFVCRVEVWMP